MRQFYCPYCSPRYQFHKLRSDGVLICGQCGDPLVQKTLIKPTQVFALIAVTAFIAPFILMVVGSLQNLNKSRPPSINGSMTMITKIRRLSN